ncbi:MAG: helix-hairpin-helix domain-containing protein [Gemmatimonadota bacterium]
MSRTERRSLAILFLLGVAGHLARAASGAPGEPAAIAFPLDSASDGNALAHRDSARALARPLAEQEQIDADHASVAEFQRLPGVGPALARRIVADRESHGAFGGIGVLDRVPGVGPALLTRLQSHLRFGGVLADTPPAEGEAVVNLNQADVAQLDALPGIGTARARAIVAFRDSAGPFRQIGDLRLVRGLPQSLVDRLAPRLTLH